MFYPYPFVASVCGITEAFFLANWLIREKKCPIEKVLDWYFKNCYILTEIKGLKNENYCSPY